MEIMNPLVALLIIIGGLILFVWLSSLSPLRNTFTTSSFDKMSFKERIGTAVSAVWVSIVSAFAANEAASAEVFDLRVFFADSVLLGLLPVFMGWGLYSILRTEKR